MSTNPLALPSPLPGHPREDAPARFRRWQSRTFWGLMAGYAGFYLCRPNLSAAAGPMGAEGFDTMAFGLVSSLGTLSYAAGKFFAGPVAESLGGRRVFLWALYGSAAVTALAGLSATIPMLALFWALGRLMQSFGWQGLVSIVPRWHAPERHGIVMGAFATSYQFGGVVAPLIVGGLAAGGLPWRSFFTVPALMLAVVGLVVGRLIVERPADRGLPPLPAPAGAAAAVDEPGTTAWQRIRGLLSRPAYLLTLGIAFSLTLLRECFNTWMPKYFMDLGEPVDLAVFRSTVFPLLGIAGTLAAGWLSDRVAGGCRGPVMAAFLAGLVLALLGLAFLPAVASRFPDLSTATVAFGLVGLAGFCLLGPYSMVGGGVLALDFGGQRTAATAAGLLDGIGYLGAALAGVGVAQVVQARGWGTAFAILACLAAATTLLTAPLWRRRG